MSSNGISKLQYKRDRQIAKLNLASSKRQAAGRPHEYQLSRLPTSYGIDNNSPLAIVDHENAEGLLPGRPWVIPEPGTPVTHNGDPVTYNGEQVTVSA